MHGLLLFTETWIPGTPRGFGYGKTEDEWLTSMQLILGQCPALPGHRYLIRMKFCVYPNSWKYGGQATVHGPDLDNLIKLTIDGLTPLGGRGTGLIADDSLVYQIEAIKDIVGSDEETGLWLAIEAC